MFHTDDLCPSARRKRLRNSTPLKNERWKKADFLVGTLTSPRKFSEFENAPGEYRERAVV